jgi:hypothetical protein
MRTLSLILAALALLLPARPALELATETTKTTETTSVHLADELAPDWACWAEGNRRCSAVALGHRS